MPRKCYLKRHRYPSPFSGTPVPRPDSLLLAAPILAVGRYGESLLDIKDNGTVSKLEQLNSLIITEIRKLRAKFNW